MFCGQFIYYPEPVILMRFVGKCDPKLAVYGLHVSLPDLKDYFSNFSVCNPIRLIAMPHLLLAWR